MIKDLDQRVDLWFEEDTKHFLLKLPYSDTGKEFLTCFSMYGVKREWLSELKAWRFDSKEYDGIMELLYQYFGIGVEECLF
jgi:hypothetical protein